MDGYRANICLKNIQKELFWAKNFVTYTYVFYFSTPQHEKLCK